MSTGPAPPGRWPANLILDEDAVAMLDEQSGERPSRYFQQVDCDGSFMLDSVTERSLSCGQGKIAEDVMFVGMRGENSAASLKADGYGSGRTARFQQDATSIIKMATRSIMSFTILSVSTGTPIGQCTIEIDGHTEWLTALNIACVSVAKNGVALIHSTSEGRQPIAGIARIVPDNIFGNGANNTENTITHITENTDGSASNRFFYTAKASRAEREAGLVGEREIVNDGRQTSIDNAYQRGDTPRLNIHATVKPVDLMEYLCRLTRTPTGGVVLDPFMGSGTTGIACVMTEREFIGIEIDERYYKIAEKRIQHAIERGVQRELFD